MRYQQQRRVRSQTLAIATLIWVLLGERVALARPVLDRPPEILHQYFGEPLERTESGTSPTGNTQVKESYDPSALQQAVPSLSDRATFSVIYEAGRARAIVLENGPVASFKPDIGKALFRYFWDYEAPIWYELPRSSSGIEGLFPGSACLGDGIRVDWQQAAVVLSLSVTYDRACEPPYPTFRDLENHWSKSYVEALKARGILNGYPDGTFQPDRTVTRAEFAAAIAGAFSIAENSESESQQQISAFRDVAPTFWGTDAIARAATGKFMTGYPDGTFRPQVEISRLEVYLALASGLELPSGNRDLLDRFQDGAAVPDYARATVAGALEKTLIVNYPFAHILGLGRPATRADMAAAIYRGLVVRGDAESLPRYRLYVPEVR